MLLTLITNIFISDSHRVILKEKEKNEKGRLEWISSRLDCSMPFWAYWYVLFACDFLLF